MEHSESLPQQTFPAPGGMVCTTSIRPLPAPLHPSKLLRGPYVSCLPFCWLPVCMAFHAFPKADGTATPANWAGSLRGSCTSKHLIQPALEEGRHMDHVVLYDTAQPAGAGGLGGGGGRMRAGTLGGVGRRERAGSGGGCLAVEGWTVPRRGGGCLRPWGRGGLSGGGGRKALAGGGLREDAGRAVAPAGRAVSCCGGGLGLG